MKKTGLLILFLFGMIGLYGQESNPASGGTATGSGGIVSYTAGQPVYIMHTGTGGTVAEGVHQPFEISTLTGDDNTFVNLEMSAWPNPAREFLYLKVDEKMLEDMADLQYQLLDLRGSLLENGLILQTESRIELEYYSAGTYLLRVMSGKQVIKSFKIIKYQ